MVCINMCVLVVKCFPICAFETDERGLCSHVYRQEVRHSCTHSQFTLVLILCFFACFFSVSFKVLKWRICFFFSLPCLLVYGLVLLLYYLCLSCTSLTRKNSPYRPPAESRLIQSSCQSNRQLPGYRETAFPLIQEQINGK